VAVPSTLSTLEYGTLLTTTLFNYRNQFYDNIYNAIPGFVMMRNRKRTEEGGERIQVPLGYAKNTTFKSMAGYDPVDTTPQDPLTSAFYEFKEFAGSIGISRDEENKNRGKYAIINMLKAKVLSAEMSASEGLAGQMGAYVVAASPSLDLDPIPFLIQIDPTQSYSVGNINQSTYSWWQNQYKEAATASFAGLIAEMRHLYNQCSKGGGGGKRSEPDWIWCCQNYYENYEAACTDKTRILKYDDTVANLGFGGAKYKNAVLTWDEYVPDAYLATSVMDSDPIESYTRTYATGYFLNTEFLEYVVMAGSDLDLGPFVRPENQLARTALIYNQANFVCSNRRKQGVHHKMTAGIAA